MKYGERFVSTDERVNAFREFCKHDCKKCDVYRSTWDCETENLCAFHWLELEIKIAEEAKPMPCPFCEGKDMRLTFDEDGDCYILCNKCGYRSPFKSVEEEAIAAHNRVCKAVAAYKGN